MKTSALVVLICMLCPALAVAQSNEAAAERARVANERIQAEAARRAEEEERRRQAEAQLAAERAAATARSEEQQPAQQVMRDDPPVTTRRPEPPRPPAGSTADMSHALEQLRTLGELKDAGYLTDEEFARIKSRILESRF